VYSAPSDGSAAGDDAQRTLSAARYDSFVVRILSHERSGGVVHGRVTHVATRRSLRFTDLQRLVAFILTHVGKRA
jgi:hypothetical protein